MRPSSMLVTWTTARHPPPTAASLLRTVRAASYGPVVPTKAGQPVARWTIPPSPLLFRPVRRRGRGPPPPSSIVPAVGMGREVTSPTRTLRAGPSGAQVIPFASTGSAGNGEPDVFVWSVD
ncbi:MULTISPECIES: hypothetical protein [Acetobacter]|uniref:hypothetical protein n=1 Tax=Acetobacter TaxID=434 RepID=UPI0015933F97|nr:MULTISPECIES: hypothetical protein [Acetobacter]MCG0995463.1 hypothetical protein [Acetobacter indonesiensis]